jgi:hypothetical protein
VLLLAYLVHSLVHLLHDVKSFEYDLILPKWQPFMGGFDVGLPHIHRKRLVSPQMLRYTTLKNSIRLAFSRFSVVNFTVPLNGEKTTLRGTGGVFALNIRIFEHFCCGEEGRSVLVVREQEALISLVFS